MNKGMSGHHSSNMMKDEWLTPPEIIEALGPFDLDPCSPVARPWPTASKHYTIKDDGLSQPWEGRVWLNPPYGRLAASWLAKLREHGRGTALIFARTDTRMFFSEVWMHASAVLFLRGRLRFYQSDGTIPGTGTKANSGAPSVLVAYGDQDRLILGKAHAEGKLEGALVEGWRAQRNQG